MYIIYYIYIYIFRLSYIDMIDRKTSNYIFLFVVISAVVAAIYS